MEEIKDKEEKRPKIKYVNRHQIIFRPLNVEELIEEDHPARGIWEFVGKLDLSKFYERIESQEGKAGRKAYDPRLLVSIWLYAYSEGIGSAREVARKCGTDNAFQWLCGLLEINYHTLSDFRIDYKEELDQVFTDTLAVLSSEGLITLHRVAQDGTKIKANAGSDTYRTEKRIEQFLELAKEQVKELEDPTSEPLTTEKIKKARRRAVRERQEKLELALNELEKIKNKKKEKDKAKARVSTTDPESRIMKQPNGGYDPSFNVQLASDSEGGIIVGKDVTQEGDDYDESPPMLEQIKDNMGKYPDEYLVDGGFMTRDTVIDSEEKGVDLIGPTKDFKDQSENQLKRRGITEEFFPDKFEYNESDNTMRCPAGRTLKYDGGPSRSGVIYHTYRCKKEECFQCEHKPYCCPNNKSSGRGVVRKEEDPVVLEFNKKMETNDAKKIYKKRGSIIEFTNACIKAKFGLRQFNLRGLVKVGIEITWVSLANNIKRWISLSWLPALQSG